MSDSKQDIVGRRLILSSIGAAAAGVVAGSAGAADSDTGFQPAMHAEDQWMADLAGSHRVFLDSSSPAGGAVALLYANNILNAHRVGYGGQESDYALIVCLRHYSTVFAFGDAVWAKYGKGLHAMVDFADPETGEAPTLNLMQAGGYGRRMPNGGNTIDSLGERGVKFAVCDNAMNVMSRGLSGQGFGEASDIYNDFIASIVPNSKIVPAGVIAATRAQEYSYSLLYAG